MKLILLRHGQSEWNLENRFTGWEDVSLTKNGVEEAKFSGEAILDNSYNIKHIYTSNLKRAIETAHIVSDIIAFPKHKIQYEWRLNERHYGALQGLNKAETALKYGEAQVKIWRRSFDIPPPKLDKNDKRNPNNNSELKKLNNDLPIGESLKDVIKRLDPFLNDFFGKISQNEKNCAESYDYLIVAHSNSLRAIVKILEQLSNDEIIDINIPTGVPLVYEINHNLQIINKEYLIDDDSLARKQEIVKNQGKVK